MDKQYLLPNFSESDLTKLTRAASYSELSKKLVYEQRFQSKNSGNLMKQYSCEQIFNENSSTRQVQVSKVLKSDTEKFMDAWEDMIPSNTLTKHISWPHENKINLHKSLSHSSQQLSRVDPNTLKMKRIIAPPKLIIRDNSPKTINTSSQNKIHIPKQCLSSNNEKLDQSIAEFKKLSLPEKKFSIAENHVIIKNEQDNEDELCDKNTLNILNENENHVQEETNAYTLDTTELNKRLRSLITVKPTKRISKRLYWPFALVILLPISIAYLIFFLSHFNYLNDFCRPQFKFDKVSQELKRNIYGQETAVNDLCKFFTTKSNQKNIDILALIGGIGVGKSYTAEIIKNNVENKNNILDFYPPLYRKEDQAYSLLSSCRCNIIRLENLKTDDIVDSVIFIHNLKKRAQNHCILFIALYNTQETNFMLKKTLDLDKSVSIISRKFKEADLHPTLISFSSMSDDALKQCIIDAAEYANIELSNNDIEYVKRDLLTTESGCKGAYAKVQLVGKAK